TARALAPMANERKSGMRITRALPVVASACIALGLAGCGTGSVAHVAAGGASTVPPTSSSQPATSTTAGPTAPSAGAVPPGWKAVTYGSVRFAVPATWPVYDLRADPSRCLTLNMNAVYLGHVGPLPSCPATAGAGDGGSAGHGNGVGAASSRCRGVHGTGVRHLRRSRHRHDARVAVVALPCHRGLCRGRQPGLRRRQPVRRLGQRRAGPG